MRITKIGILLFAFAFTMIFASCGGEKGKVIKYLEKIDKYVNSEDYKKTGMGFIDQCLIKSENGEITFDENKFNELVIEHVSAKDDEMCKSAGFKDREEAGNMVNKYMAEPEVKQLTEKIDKSMSEIAIEFQKEGMARSNKTTPPMQKGQEPLIPNPHEKN